MTPPDSSATDAAPPATSADPVPVTLDADATSDDGPGAAGASAADDTRDAAGGPGAAGTPDTPEGTAPPRRVRTSQSMKASTAAAKLGVHLPATPESFRAGTVTREELDALQRTPPPWLVELRRTGPHPRSVVAARLRVSTSGLARAGLTEPLTTAQIDDLIADPPPWLHRERASLAEVKREEQRLRERDAQRRAGQPAP